MQVHTLRIPSELGQTHLRYLCSDFHIGTPNCDEKRLKADLAEARDAGARILINGDVFDCIAPSDRKRHMPSTLHPKLQGKDDLSPAIVKMGFEIIKDYAEAIDVIGIGNHEESWIKFYHDDPVARLIEQLNAHLEKLGSSHRIRHGGICGWIYSKFTVPAGNQLSIAAHRLYYFHGAGGDSPVTRGTIDINRKAVQFNYDAITFGHKHNRLFSDDVMLDLTPQGHVRERERLALQTGSYYVNYTKQSQKNPLGYSYATSKAHSPKPLGGLYLIMTPRKVKIGAKGDSTLLVVEQNMATSVSGLMELGRLSA